MAARRLWLTVVLGLVGGFVPFLSAHAADQPAASTRPADFQILAVTPDRQGNGYRMVPVGETRIDSAAYQDVVKLLPTGFLGFGYSTPDYDERAELAQCKAACAANAKCGNFTYVRPGKNRPVGVCHLRRAVDVAQPTVVQATPIASAPPAVAQATPIAGAPPAVVQSLPVPDPTPAAVQSAPIVDVAQIAKPPLTRIVIGNGDKPGRAEYGPDSAPTAPVIFKFKTPVSGTTVGVRTTDGTGGRTWVFVDAHDAKGRRIKRSRASVAFGDRREIAIAGDEIASIRVHTRSATGVTVDRLDYAQDTPAAATPDAVAEAAIEEDEAVPPAPVPELVAEQFALPPRPQTIAALPADDANASTPEPADAFETAPPTEEATQPSADAPASAMADAAPVKTAAVEADAEQTPATPTRDVTPAFQDLNEEEAVLGAAGVLLFLVGGAGIYRSNYRARTMKRMTTTIVSDGLDRQSIEIDSGDQKDMSLRFAVRAHAGVGARHTMITIVPDGVAA